MALSRKQLAFARALIAGKNKRQAAIAAGCRPETASQNATSMMRSGEVARYIERQAKAEEVRAEAKAAGKSPGDLGKLAQQFDDPQDFLDAVMNNTDESVDTRLKAAALLMPYRHGKQKNTTAMPRLGKKEETKRAATAAGTGIFGTADTARGTLQ